MKNRRFLTFLLSLALAVTARGYSPEYDQNGRLSFLKADLNRDGYFNIVDIGLVASAWLDEFCGLSNPCEGADIFPHGGDGIVDFRDFSSQAETHGLCIVPEHPNCIHVPLTLFEPPSVQTWLPPQYSGFESVPFPEYGINGRSFGTPRPGGGGNSGDIFDNIENFQMAGNLVLALEPDASGLLGSSNNPFWKYGGSATGLPESGLLPGFSFVDRNGNEYQVDLSYDSGGYGTYRSQGAKPLAPSLGLIQPAVMHNSMSHPPLWGAYGGGSYGTYGNQGVKPLVPSLPGGGGGNETGIKMHSGNVEVFEGATVDLGFDFSVPEKGSASKVNLFSGEFTETVVDMHIPGRGPDFVWQRTYRSRLGPNTVSGNGWDFSYNIYIEPDRGNLILHDGTGRRDIYYPQTNGTWTSDGFFREFIHEPGSFHTLTFSDGGVWRFRSLSEPTAPGKISAITDRNGNSTTFDYDKYGRMIGTRKDQWASHNPVITISYNANGLIESVTDWTGRSVTYAYYTVGEPNGSPGDLKSVTTPTVQDTPTGNDFPEGKTTTYTYSKGFADERLNHNLLSITDAKGQTYLQNTYGTDPAELSFDHVTRQIVGEPNDIIDIAYMQQAPDGNNSYAVTRAVTNDRVGNVKEYFFSNRNELLIFREYTGRAEADLPTSINPNVNVPTNPMRPDDPAYFETKFEYNKDSLLTRVTYHNGNYVTNVYESELEPDASPRSRGNLREIHRFAGGLEAVSDQNETVELFEYNTDFGRCGCGGCGCRHFMTRYVNLLGYETLYDYDPNGNRTRTEHVRPAEPNIIYEWQYNEYGQLTASILPDNGSGHRRRDEYTYYTEDDLYQNGYLKNIVVDANNSALTAGYEYDDVGNVIRIIDARGHDRRLVVNSLGQVVRNISREVTNSSGVRYERDYYYDENNNVVRIDTQNKDEQGEEQSNTHFTATYEYDILNRLTRSTSEVDSNRAVLTEFKYNDDGSLTIIFGDGVPGNVPPTGKKITARYDERSFVYQTIRGESDSIVSTTQYDYDGNGNLKKVSEGLEDTPRITSFGYDGYDRLVEANDPMGNVVKYHYDAAGNPVSMHIIGELVDVVGNNDKTTMLTHFLEYNSLGQVVTETTFHHETGSQTPIGDGNSITQFFYNDNSQLARVVDDNGNQRHFEYDTANRLRAVTDAKENKVICSYDE
ncbi:MAG: RHS repeat domain-containing protein, partial [Planctomycetota bacterium]